MAAVGEKVARWIKARLDEIPSASRFVLRVVSAHNPQGEILFKQDVPKVFKPKEFGEEVGLDIMQASRDCAESMSGMVSFTLQAFSRKPSADESSKKVQHALRTSLKFVMKGMAQEELGLIVESETPDKKGINAMLMRHLENKEQMMNGILIAFTEGVREENSSLRKRVSELEENQTLSRKKHEELLDRSVEREIMRDDASSKRSRKDMMVKKVADEVIPQLATQIPQVLASLGMGPPPSTKQLGPGDLVKTKVRELFAGLSEYDRIWFMKKLPDVPGAEFLALLTDDKERTMEEVKRIALAAFSSLGEDDRFDAIQRVNEEKREELMTFLGFGAS